MPVAWLSTTTTRYKYKMVEYIDFASICDDNDLRSGDIHPEQVEKLEQVLTEFINQNK